MTLDPNVIVPEANVPLVEPAAPTAEPVAEPAPPVDPQTPPAEQTPPPETGIAPEPEGVKLPEAPGQETPAPAEYTPNMKFKVMDKEHEIKDYFKRSITKENEAEIRELHEKAYGLPHVKEKYTSSKAEVERLRPIETQYTKQKQEMDYLGGLKADNLHAFHKAINVTDEQIVKLALDITNRTPEQQAAHNQSIQASQDILTVQQENTNLRSEAQNNAVRTREAELRNALTNETVSATVQAFDAKEGFPGAFAKKVQEHAAKVFNTYKVDLTAEQAVQGMLMTVGNSLQAPPAAPQPGSTLPVQIPPAAPPAAAPAKPVITNIKAGRQSPAPQPVTSTDGLRALRKQKYGH